MLGRGADILEDKWKNPDLHSVAEREIMHHYQLECRTTSLYGILFRTIPWLDKKMKDMLKLTFIHGDKIDSPMEKVTNCVTYAYTNSKGNDIVISSPA